MHPPSLPREVAVGSRPSPAVPAGNGRKALLSPVIPDHSRLARERQDRPVTPEVAGSSPVAPVYKNAFK